MADPADRIYQRLLIVRCQLGDAAAFEELIGECQPRLRAFLHKMLPSGNNIDDLAQEVWMDVFRDLGQLSDPAAFVPWFYRVARNRVFRMLRRRGEPTVRIDEHDESSSNSNGEPEFTPDDAAAVHQAIDALAPEQREVLLLRFIEEMSYEDIAAVAGCPVGTVRSRLHHAKRSLRQILRPGES